MSRTHKTKPFRVKLEQGIVPSREIHHHHNGECNIEQGSLVRWWGWGDRCYRELVWDGKNHCCSRCHHDEMDTDKRQRKTGEKKYLREWDKDYHSRDRDFDYYLDEVGLWSDEA